MTSMTFFLIFVPILAIILLAVNLIFAPHNPYQEKDSAFECGFHSFLGQNRTQFSISFFIFALLFLLFDLEILLVYPYVVSAYSNGIYGLVVMLIFFLALTLGFAFELGKNALKIDSRQMLILESKYNKVVSYLSLQASIGSAAVGLMFGGLISRSHAWLGIGIGFLLVNAMLVGAMDPGELLTLENQMDALSRSYYANADMASDFSCELGNYHYTLDLMASGRETRPMLLNGDVVALRDAYREAHTRALTDLIELVRLEERMVILNPSYVPQYLDSLPIPIQHSYLW